MQAQLLGVLALYTTILHELDMNLALLVLLGDGDLALLGDEDLAPLGDGDLALSGQVYDPTNSTSKIKRS